MIVHTDRICNNIYTFAHPDCSNRKRYCRLPKASFPIMPVPNRLVLHRKASDTTVCAEKSRPLFFILKNCRTFASEFSSSHGLGKNAELMYWKKERKRFFAF